MIRQLIRTNDFQLGGFAHQKQFGRHGMMQRPSIPENDQSAYEEGVSEIVNTAGNALESENTHREGYDK
jgi:hypothetical protein